MYKELLKQVISAKSALGMSIQPPASDDQIARLRVEARQKLRAELPGDYIRFLRLMNGLDFDGLLIYGTDSAPIIGVQDATLIGLLDANLGFRDASRFGNLIVYGQSGDDLYLSDTSLTRFSISDRISLYPVHSFTSFEGLLAKALEGRLRA
jgi:hypothetical protein